MSVKCFFNYLTVGCWNIEGLFEKVNGTKISKLEDPCFLKTLNTIDILCLQETHISQDEDIPIPKGFRSIPHCRKISGNSRYFGGLLILIRKSIEKGIKLGNFKDEDAFHIIVRRDFFGLNEDKHIIFTYASPLNSCYTKSRSENIFDKIETNAEDKNLIIMGDLNGKTELDEDFVRNTDYDHSPVINNQCYMKDSPSKRQNSDPHLTDLQGKRILEMCKNMSLRILNGRTSGDIQGKFTRFPKHLRENPSLID